MNCLPLRLSIGFGDAAHYFNPEDKQAITTAIAEVLGDKKLRDRLIKIGYEQVKKYSWRKMAQETLEQYKKALK